MKELENRRLHRTCSSIFSVLRVARLFFGFSPEERSIRRPVLDKANVTNSTPLFTGVDRSENVSRLPFLSPFRFACTTQRCDPDISRTAQREAGQWETHKCRYLTRSDFLKGTRYEELARHGSRINRARDSLYLPAHCRHVFSARARKPIFRIKSTVSSRNRRNVRQIDPLLLSLIVSDSMPTLTIPCASRLNITVLWSLVMLIHDTLDHNKA